MSVRVTCEDLSTGETETMVVPDGDYLLVCVAPCRLDYTQTFGGGRTHQLTIMNRRPS